MKIHLVVASGVHEGKVIPITTSQFMIGRDPSCQLRPASQAVSKQHCAIIVRGEKVFLKDYGSTNGTTLNDEVLRNAERPIHHNDRIKVGPLEFSIRIETTAQHQSLGGAPSEMVKKQADEALSSVKAVAGKGGSSEGASERPTTPSRKTPSTPSPQPALSSSKEPSQEDIAAMLLGMNEEDSAESVPDGSTVMEVPALQQTTTPQQGSTKPSAPKGPTREETSNAASELLKKMLRRPR